MAARSPAWAEALFPSAVRAASEGESANVWLQALRESGAGIRRQTGLQIFGQAKALVAEYSQEPTRPLGSVPTASESRQWPTTRTSGVLQTVQLFYREHVTNRVLSRFYSVRSTEGVTRGEAIRRAITAYSASPPASEGGSKPDQADFIGAVHTGTAVLVATGGLDGG